MQKMPSSRPHPNGNADQSPSGASNPGVSLTRGTGAEMGTQASQTASLTSFFLDALDGAMTLVRADGGEIATIDESRQVLVLRARRTRPRLDTLHGMPARSSQPLQPSGLQQQLGPGMRFGSPSVPGFGQMAGPRGSDPYDPGALDDDAIDEQSTQLLPAALNTRIYRRGERLMGHTWERAEPVILRGDECRSLPGGAAPADPEAAWYLSVPIMRPGSFSVSQSASDVIGVLSVYNRDPLWRFSAHDVELLLLHADRIARATQAVELARQNQGQSDLLNALASDLSGAGPQSLYTRLRDLVRGMIDAPSLAIVLYHRRTDDVTYELAERDGQPVPMMGHVPTVLLPAWWGEVCAGRTMCISAPEDRALHPEYCLLGWGGDHPVQSILAAPLAIGNALLGAIIAGSNRTDVYAPEHGHIFANIARSAAILLQNARLAEETRTSLARAREKELQLSILNNAVLTLNASLNTDETWRALAQQAAQLTEAQACAVFDLDDAGERLRGKASSGKGGMPLPDVSEVSIPLSWQGLREVLPSGQFVFADSLDALWSDDDDVGAFLAEQKLRSCLIIPLVQKEHALGALLAYTPDVNHQFTPEEIGLLQGLATQGALAISNARLFEHEQAMNQSLQEAFEKQKELDRLKDDFILTVSHEFRTPVTAIDGYVTLIGRHGQKLDQEKLDRYANEIRQATRQLTGMVSRLNDANTLESQPLQLVLTPIHVRAVVEEAIAMHAPDARGRITMDVSDDLWAIGEHEHAVGILSNLLSNALKYSDVSLPCTVVTRVERRETLSQQGRLHAMSEDAPDQWVVIGVRDRGEGISKDDQPMLFKKFVRLSRSLTTPVRGTGLGLWICQRYVEAMNGDIWVDSEFGKGAFFQFSLPLATELLPSAG